MGSLDLFLLECLKQSSAYLKVVLTDELLQI